MGAALGGVSDPGSETADTTSPAEDNGRDVELHLGGCGKGSGSFIDYGGIRQAAPEHGRTVYRYTITVVVKRQAEEVGKRVPDKLRAQGNYKHKTRARLKSALGNKKQEDIQINLRLS